MYIHMEVKLEILTYNTFYTYICICRYMPQQLEGYIVIYTYDCIILITFINQHMYVVLLKLVKW